MPNVLAIFSVESTESGRSLGFCPKGCARDRNQPRHVLPKARRLLEDQLGEAVPGEDIGAAIVIGPPSGKTGLGGLGQ